MNYLSYLINLLAPASSDAAYAVYRTVSAVFIILMFVAALAAIVLVLLQPGNSQGIDALGGSSETFFGKNKGRSIESRMKKWTWICLAVMTVLAIVAYAIALVATSLLG